MEGSEVYLMILSQNSSVYSEEDQLNFSDNRRCWQTEWTLSSRICRTDCNSSQHMTPYTPSTTTIISWDQSCDLIGLYQGNKRNDEPTPRSVTDVLSTWKPYLLAFIRNHGTSNLKLDLFTIRSQGKLV